MIRLTQDNLKKLSKDLGAIITEEGGSRRTSLVCKPRTEMIGREGRNKRMSANGEILVEIPSVVAVCTNLVFGSGVFVER